MGRAAAAAALETAALSLSLPPSLLAWHGMEGMMWTMEGGSSKVDVGRYIAQLSPFLSRSENNYSVERLLWMLSTSQTFL